MDEQLLALEAGRIDVLLDPSRSSSQTGSMSRQRHDVDTAAAFAEFADLWSAETADELHQILVVRAPYRRSADSFEPFQLLAKHHQSEPDTSLVTATLLLTDRRWRNGVGQLVRQIADSNILEPAALDLLAETFVAADEFVYWQVPDSWFGDDSIVIDLTEGSDPAPEPKSTDSDLGPTVARRSVHPPLRRWASARIVRRDPTAWGHLFARARGMDRRGGAALMSGLLDAIDTLTAATQRLLIDAAVEWRNDAVRRLGLALIADRDGPQAAYDKAHHDPNARVRSWAQSLIEAEPVEVSKVDVPPNPGGTTRASPSVQQQPPLF